MGASPLLGTYYAACVRLLAHVGLLGAYWSPSVPILPKRSKDIQRVKTSKTRDSRVKKGQLVVCWTHDGAFGPHVGHILA